MIYDWDLWPARVAHGRRVADIGEVAAAFAYSLTVIKNAMVLSARQAKVSAARFAEAYKAAVAANR